MGTHYQGSEEARRALDTYIKLTRATDTVTERIQHVMASANLSISQFGTLEVLYHLGPLCQSDIASKILKSHANMTTVIDNLVKRGLVTREHDEADRRQWIIHLTSDGESLIAALFPLHVAALVEALSALTPAEHDDLGRLLKIAGLGRREP